MDSCDAFHAVMEAQVISRHHALEPRENQCSSVLVRHIKAPANLVSSFSFPPVLWIDWCCLDVLWWCSAADLWLWPGFLHADLSFIFLRKIRFRMGFFFKNPLERFLMIYFLNYRGKLLFGGDFLFLRVCLVLGIRTRMLESGFSLHAPFLGSAFFTRDQFQNLYFGILL